jgi:glutamate:Na+ symporter, ESS family
MHEQSFFPMFGAFGWLAIMLLVGVVLRAKVGIFQKYLFPAAIIGGLIGFVLKSVGWINISYDTFTLFAIHFFTINFISIGLTGTEDAVAPEGSTVRKAMIKGMVWMACLWAALFSFQALIGMGVLVVTNTFLQPIYVGVGYLVPSGFAQGPGQAVALAAVWERGFNINDAISFGLTFAAVGFLVASLVGVPLANWGLRKGLAVNKSKELPREFLVGIHDEDKQPSAGKLITHSANIDGLAFQVAIVMTVYFVTYFACLGLKAILPASIKAVAFGLMFMWGMIIAFIARFILKKLGLSRFMDNNVQRRITGVAVDFMIVATLMAVQVATVLTHILPIFLICLLVSIFTFFFLLFFGRRLGEYSFERLLALFGTSTGTAASGLLLLRIVDPDFKTPVAFEVGMMNVFLLILLPTNFIIFTLPQIGLLTGIIMSAVMAIVPLIIVKLIGEWRKKAW